MGQSDPSCGVSIVELPIILYLLLLSNIIIIFSGHTLSLSLFLLSLSEMDRGSKKRNTILSIATRKGRYTAVLVVKTESFKDPRSIKSGTSYLTRLYSLKDPLIPIEHNLTSYVNRFRKVSTVTFNAQSFKQNNNAIKRTLGLSFLNIFIALPD